MTRTYETKLVFRITKFPVTAKSHLKDINKSYVTALDLIIHKQKSRYISNTHSLLHCFYMDDLICHGREMGAFLVLLISWMIIY